MPPYIHKFRRWLLYGTMVLVLLFVLLAVLADKYVEPVLRSRLETLVVQGSDGLYRYSIGSLNASFFGGSVEIDNLKIEVDSARYKELRNRNALPALTMQLDLHHGHIRGLGVFSLVFGKKIVLKELLSRDAELIVTRQTATDTTQRPETPLWKAVQPNINSIAIKKMELDGIKLLYKNADTSRSMKLQFDTCIAILENIRIDSASAQDKDRIGFAKEIELHFNDLKYRSADSTMKLKARSIDYSSKERKVEITGFKLQPTLKEKEMFYKAVASQRSMTVIEYERLVLTEFRLQDFIHHNAVLADSLLVSHPRISIYLDKTEPPTMESKMGRYPHQLLAGAGPQVHIKGAAIDHLSLSYTERGEKSRKEGTFLMEDVNIRSANITNIPSRLARNNRISARIYGKILGGSPMDLNFLFYMDSSNGRFDVQGKINNVKAAQLNNLAEPLGNTSLRSFNLQELSFKVSGDDFSASADVGLLYNNLFVILQKTDAQTGQVSTKKLLTKVLNKYTLEQSNPGPDGRLREARHVVRSRLTTQGFFGLIWQTIFTGMQEIITGG